MELAANQFPSEIHEICHKFSSSGFKAFVVGGSIRDLLRGEMRPSDWDIATDASPFEVMDLFNQ
ncbi:MAG: polynucleotide adenylyltransferase PcnB, partial [Candidatus Hodarchaeales archaeon]